MSEREQQLARDVASGTRGPVVLVTSPHSGGARAGDAVKELELAGVTVGAHLNVGDLDHLTPMGTTWREQGYDAAIAAGGDGTIGAVASHLAGSGLPLGILPLGTSNDVARSLGVPLDLAKACEVIAHGVPTKVDMGQVSPAVTEPEGLALHAHEHEIPASSRGAARSAPPRAYFLHALTLGFNVQFARLATDVARRKRWGPLNYATSVLEALTHLQPVPVTLRLSGVKDGSGQQTAEDHVVTVQALQIAVVNTPVFGGGLNLRLPDVQLRDDLLDFVVIEALAPNALRATVEGLLAALTTAGEAVRERISQLTQQPTDHVRDQDQQEARAQAADEAAGLALPGVRRFKARSAIVETPGSLDLTLDGEIRSHTPARICVSPDPLRILLPVEAHAALVGEEVLAEAQQTNTTTQ